MDIRWLEDFLALAELRNFTLAAEVRNLSQAAFSRRIQALEHWLGAKVVVRGVTPVRLTEAGDQLRETASHVVDRLNDTRTAIRARQFDMRNRIRVAMPNVLARSQFRQVLELIEENSPASFSVTVGNTHEVAQRYLARDADLLLTHDCGLDPSHDALAGHERMVVRRDRFLPFATRDERRRAQFGLPGDETRPFPLVAYDQRAYFARLFDRVLSRADPLPHCRVKVQCDMSDVLKEVIIAGHGVGWLPESAVDQAALELIGPVGPESWRLDVDICAYRPLGAVAPEVDSLWSALQRVAQR